MLLHRRRQPNSTQHLKYYLKFLHRREEDFVDQQLLRRRHLLNNIDL
jgi:hypothetical protein